MSARLARPNVYRCGDVEVDVVSRLIRVGSQPADPTYVQFEILLHMIREPGRVFTRDELRTALSDGRVASPRSVDIQIFRLRRALANARRFVIETVPHVGYRCREVHDNAGLESTTQPSTSRDTE